jgi:methylmalonyl-CoA mutase
MAWSAPTEDAMPTNDPTFAAEFPAQTREQWLKLVEHVLKGASFEKRLVSRTYDNIAIAPLYPRAGSAAPVAGRAPGAPWQVMQRVDHPDPRLANKQALEDLENGANGLTLVFADSLNANGYGLDASPETVARVLDGIELDADIIIDFNLGPATRPAVDHVVTLLKARKFMPASVDLRPSLNPIGGFAALGSSPKTWKELSTGFAAAVRNLAEQGFEGPLVVADGRIIHNAGGSEVQELAFALATAVDCLRALNASGIALETACRMIYFRLTADTDQFLTIAKFRAIRKLWARVEEACGVAPMPTTVAAETAWRMMTRRDPFVNMLRTTIAVAAAGLGGADNIVALPHTTAIGLPDAFARRIARNTQLILLEESNLSRVADPAAGSGAFEALTEEICLAAWSLFQTIDAAGGAWAGLESGFIQREVATARAARQHAIARGKDALTGVTTYPNLHEQLVGVLAVPRVIAPKASPATVEPLPSIRLAQPFEKLRDESDRSLADTGARPKVFLANLGTPSDFTARATFAKNFFESGGIESVTNDGFARAADSALLLPMGEVDAASRPSVTNLSALVSAYASSGAALVCICSSDKIYANEAAAAAQALKAAGAMHIYLAGRPGEMEPAYRNAGVKDFIYAGCDMLATLRAAHGIIAAKP